MQTGARPGVSLRQPAPAPDKAQPRTQPPARCPTKPGHGVGQVPHFPPRVARTGVDRRARVVVQVLGPRPDGSPTKEQSRVACN
jgi:hypothetical protein